LELVENYGTFRSPQNQNFRKKNKKHIFFTFFLFHIFFLFLRPLQHQLPPIQMRSITQLVKTLLRLRLTSKLHESVAPMLIRLHLQRHPHVLTVLAEGQKQFFDFVTVCLEWHVSHADFGARVFVVVRVALFGLFCEVVGARVVYFSFECGLVRFF